MANLHLTQEKLDALRSEYKYRNSPHKYPRPKTKPEYQLWFPWLMPDDFDPHFVFCTVCECRLSAKRSDLGKHEGSIKHTENAQRKGLILPPKNGDGTENSESPSAVKWEYNDEQYADENLLHFTESMPQDGKTDMPNDGDSGDGGNVVPDDDDERGESFEYEPKRKRFASETDSQHSGLLDYLPLQVTINEPLTSGTLISSVNGTGAVTTHLNGSMPAQFQPSPCRITIKKVTTPVIKPVPNAQPNEITTKATITPIGGNYALSQQQQQCAQQQAANAQQHQQLQQQYTQNLTTTTVAAPATFTPQQIQQPLAVAPARDSFDLFFDSICATVKELPPKLATEGKIRVMQLIGELEMRAISERESQQNIASNSSVSRQRSTNSAAAGPQNATVASTTK